MENVKISAVCGLCAGCKIAIDTAKTKIKNGKSVTIFKEIVHNKNVNSSLTSMGANFEDNIDNLNPSNTIIIRAHGEPPETYKIFESKNLTYIDCTCPNVKKIHNLVKDFSDNGYKIIILGKFHNAMHPEVLGTFGWAKNQAILIEKESDLDKLINFSNEKFYLVCQTTFNMEKADLLIAKIQKLLQEKNELIINKSLCIAQKTINEFSVKLALDSDIMIVVGGKNSSNSKELFNNVSRLKPSIFIEDIYTYKNELDSLNISINSNTKIGITAGASTMKEELEILKALIEEDYFSK